MMPEFFIFILAFCFLLLACCCFILHPRHTNREVQNGKALHISIPLLSLLSVIIRVANESKKFPFGIGSSIIHATMIMYDENEDDMHFNPELSKEISPHMWRIPLNSGHINDWYAVVNITNRLMSAAEKRIQ